MPSGARDSEKVYLTLEVECQKLDRILSVTVCHVRLGLDAFVARYYDAARAGSYTKDTAIKDYELTSIAACDSRAATIVEVDGDGVLNVQAVFTIAYQYDTATPTADWTGSVLSVEIEANRSHSLAASVIDEYSFAFRIASTNAPTRVSPSLPSVSLEHHEKAFAFAMPQASIPQPIATTLGKGILGSALSNASAVSFWEAGTTIPGANLGTYPEREAFMVVSAVPGKIACIIFEEIDLEFATDRLYLIDGDSVVSSRVAGVYDETSESWADTSTRFANFFNK